MRYISDRLAKPTTTRVYVTMSCINLFWRPNIRHFEFSRVKLPRGVSYCHTKQRCYLLPLLLTCPPLPLCYLLSSPRLWETRDQRFPGSLSLPLQGTGRRGPWERGCPNPCLTDADLPNPLTSPLSASQDDTGSVLVDPSTRTPADPQLRRSSRVSKPSLRLIQEI